MIRKGIGGFYYVEAAGTLYECKARGVFRKEGMKPLSGDRVEITTQPDRTGSIDRIYPRRNMLVRPPVANIDQLFFVTSVCDPAPNCRIIDKTIAVAEDKEIEPVLVITKTDIEDGAWLAEIYRLAGIRVIPFLRFPARVSKKSARCCKGKYQHLPEIPASASPRCSIACIRTFHCPPAKSAGNSDGDATRRVRWICSSCRMADMLQIRLDFPRLISKNGSESERKTCRFASGSFCRI